MNQDARSPSPGLWASIKESLSGSEQDFTEGSLNRAVGLLAVPMVLEMAGESVFAIADAFWVARLGSEALAAVGLTESLLEIVYAIAIGLAMATTAMVSRRIGEKDQRGAARAGVQAIIIGIATAVIFGAAGAVFASDLLVLMGASPETVETGAAYTRVMYAGMVTILLLFLNNAIYRGAGDAATAMRALWLANGINVVLDPCLIFGWGPFPELGLMGAAVATTIGRGTGVIYQLWGLSRAPRLQVRRSDVRFDLAVITRLLRLSAGGVGQMLIRDGELRRADPHPRDLRKRRPRRLRRVHTHRDLRHPAVLGAVERRGDARRAEPGRGEAGSRRALGVDHGGVEHGPSWRSSR